MYDITQANQWAASKQLPGQFLGSTGVQCLTPQELAGPDKRNQAWARKVGFSLNTSFIFIYFFCLWTFSGVFGFCKSLPAIQISKPEPFFDRQVLLGFKSKPIIFLCESFSLLKKSRHVNYRFPALH